jgi:hypothetical protein
VEEEGKRKRTTGAARRVFVSFLFPPFFNKQQHFFPKDTGTEFPVRER